MVIRNCYCTHKGFSIICFDSLTKKQTTPLPKGRWLKDTQIKFKAMEIVMNKPVVINDMKKKMADIMLSISWRDFANTYFQKSSSWFYHKMDGIDGNGGKGGFNEDEAEQMRGALIDLSDRIRRAAESI